MRKEKMINQKAFRPAKGFIGQYQKLIKEVVIPYQYKVLCDLLEGTEKSHVVQNFINAGKVLQGEVLEDGFYGMVFQDSDAAKWLEAVGFSLSVFPDATLEHTADELIDAIAKAQDADGYLNTYFTIKDKDKRWKNLMEGHELYCSGHMMEAACAYYEATGKDTLLNVMLKNMDHIYDLFISNGFEGYPGHPEVELALMRMYHVTGNEKCLTLAKHFVDVRGVDPYFYEKEAKKRDWTVWNNDPSNHEYMQSHKPVREQSDAVGHSVRAVYLYTGMADLAIETGDQKLMDACERLWNSIVNKRMYLTAGIGSTVLGEAFTVDYDLPNDTAYAETCASIGLMFFAAKMRQNDMNGKYTDVMERAFYNTVLAGMELDGTKFFYVNPLEIVPGISAVAATHKHDLTVRPKWYTCACCPPNTARLISSFGTYAYGETEETSFCHLYADGTVAFDNGMEVQCETGYPYSPEVNYKVLQGKKQLGIRIPAWSKDNTILVNGQQITAELVTGYVYLNVEEGDTIQLILDMKAHFVYASSLIPKLTTSIAVCRGPLVYCFEGVDNGGDVLALSLKEDSEFKLVPAEESVLKGVTKIQVEATRVERIEGLYTTEKPREVSEQAIAVPYYVWGNRGENQMRVWMNRVN